MPDRFCAKLVGNFGEVTRPVFMADWELGGSWCISQNRMCLAFVHVPVRVLVVCLDTVFGSIDFARLCLRPVLQELPLNVLGLRIVIARAWLPTGTIVEPDHTPDRS